MSPFQGLQNLFVKIPFRTPLTSLALHHMTLPSHSNIWNTAMFPQTPFGNFKNCHGTVKLLETSSRIPETLTRTPLTPERIPGQRDLKPVYPENSHSTCSTVFNSYEEHPKTHHRLSLHLALLLGTSCKKKPKTPSSTNKISQIPLKDGLAP